MRKKQEAAQSSVSGERSQSSGAGEALSEVLQGNNGTIILINQHKSDKRTSWLVMCVFLYRDLPDGGLFFKSSMYDVCMTVYIHPLRSLYVESRQERNVA